MRELKTLYPYGRNGKHNNNYYSSYSEEKLVWTIFHQTIKRKTPRKGEHPQRLEKQRERERVRMRTPSHNRVRAINNLNTPTTHERPHDP